MIGKFQKLSRCPKPIFEFISVYALPKGIYFLIVLFVMGSSWVHAMPKGGHVKSGHATFSSNDKNLVISISDQAVIHWDEFSIAAGELTRFQQPGRNAVVLNRVMGGNPSEIFGTLEANGKVFLINPNGIFVGKEGVINVGSFVASTLDILKGDALKGEDLLFAGKSQGKVVNLGRISAWDGDVILMGMSVENAGTIQAPCGVAGVGVGEEILLSQVGGERLFIRVGGHQTKDRDIGIDQAGSLEALQVELKSKGNPYALAIRHRGKIDALSVEERGGRVFLVAEEGRTEVSGAIVARNLAGNGGEVRVLGDEVGVLDSGVIDVSGASGGGTVLLGGDFQGSNPFVLNASQTVVEAGARILGDAEESGNGGKVFVWSRETTAFYGAISVQGGKRGGDGGLVALLGDDHFDFRGTANRLAPAGKAGTLILDPTNITIGERSDKNIPQVTPFHPLSTSTPSFLNVDTLLAALERGDVIVQSAGGKGSQSGYVVLKSPLSYDSEFSLTLRSFVPGVTSGDVQVDAPIVNVGEGGIVLDSCRDINVSAPVEAKGLEGITMMGGRDIHICRPIKTGGHLTVSASDDVDVLASLEAQGGIDISSKGNIDVLSPMKTSSSGIALNSGAEITLLSTIESEGEGGVRISGEKRVTIGSKESSSPSSIHSLHGGINIVVTHGDVTLVGGKEKGASVSIYSDTAPITINATEVEREIRLQGGDAEGAHVSIRGERGPVSLWSGGKIQLLSGSSELFDVAASVSTAQGNMRLRAQEDIVLKGGGRGPFSNPACLRSQEGNMSVTAKGVYLIAGEGNESGALIEGGTKRVSMNAGSLTLLGGKKGEGAVARIHSDGGSININTADHLILEGGSGDGCAAEIASEGGQVVFNNIGGDLRLLGGSGKGASAHIGDTSLASEITFYSIGGDVILQGGKHPTAVTRLGTRNGNLQFPEEGIAGSLRLDGSSAPVRIDQRGDLVIKVKGVDGIVAGGDAQIAAQGSLTIISKYGMNLQASSCLARQKLSVIAKSLVMDSGVIECSDGDLSIHVGDAFFGSRDTTACTQCAALHGDLNVKSEGNCSLQGGKGKGAFVELLGGKSIAIRSNGNLSIQGGSGEGSDASIVAVDHDVLLNVTGDITLGAPDASHASVRNLGGGEGNLTVVSYRDVKLGRGAFFENLGDGELNAFADRDLILSENAYFINYGRGVLATAAGSDMLLSDRAAMLHQGKGNLFIVSGRDTLMKGAFTAQTTSGDLTVVVDHFIPGHPIIGDGSFVKENGVTLSSSSGKVQIYTARRQHNTIEGEINGQPFVPCPSYEDSENERWHTFFQDDVKMALDFFWNPSDDQELPILLASYRTDSKAPAFVIYYKDGVTNPISWNSATISRTVAIDTSSKRWERALETSNRIARAESEALQDLRTLTEFLYVPKRFLVSYDAMSYCRCCDIEDCCLRFDSMVDEYELLLRKYRTYNTKKLSQSETTPNENTQHR